MKISVEDNTWNLYCSSGEIAVHLSLALVLSKFDESGPDFPMDP